MVWKTTISYTNCRTEWSISESMHFTGHCVFFCLVPDETWGFFLQNSLLSSIFIPFVDHGGWNPRPKRDSDGHQVFSRPRIPPFNVLSDTPNTHNIDKREALLGPSFLSLPLLWPSWSRENLLQELSWWRTYNRNKPRMLYWGLLLKLRNSDNDSSISISIRLPLNLRNHLKEKVWAFYSISLRETNGKTWHGESI